MPSKLEWHVDDDETRTWATVEGDKHLVADKGRFGKWFVPYGPMKFYFGSLFGPADCGPLYDTMEAVQIALEGWHEQSQCEHKVRESESSGADEYARTICKRCKAYVD